MGLVWDRLAGKYDRLWVQKYSLAPTRREVVRRVRALGATRLLDIGCGTGQLIAEVLAATGASCVGMDKSAAMIRAAGDKGLNAEFLNLDISAPLPAGFYPGAFDVITCTHSLPYYKDKRAVIDTIAGLMDGNTTVIFVQAAINNPYDGVVMRIIEKTAEQAEYLSKKDFLRLTGELLSPVEEFQIRERWFMPSICGYLMKGKDARP